MEEMDIGSENNQRTSNLVPTAEQLEQLSNGDKADNSYTVGQTLGKFSFDTDNISVCTDEEDSDPFSPAESDAMEPPKDFKPRMRRVSDVIDSIGDCLPDSTDCSHTMAANDRTRVPASPMSSGYGSTDNVTPQSVASPDWHNNLLPSPKRTGLVPHFDLTDAAMRSAADALPMDQSQDISSRSGTPEAIMPVDKDAEEYNMNHKRRGKAVILNHEKFDNNTMPLREGSHMDVESLEITYKALGFEVDTHNNLDYCQIKSIITNLAQEDHSDADCILVTVLTHGMGNNYLLSKDVPYNSDLLWTPFTANNCPTLAGKPKIFIVQACRGEKLDPGVKLTERRESRTETDSSTQAYKIPTHADFLLAYSTVEGYYSWRNPYEGTWFIQCLCEELQKRAETTDLLKIMTHTARRVALDHESFNDVIPWQHQQKQVPSFNSMLIRDLYFRPKV